LAAWREIDGVVVIISPQDSVLHELNSTGSFLWKQLNGERSQEELARLVSLEFDVDPDEALRDVREFLAGLAAKHLLVSCAEAAHG
jgi:hypothetical protein